MTATAQKNVFHSFRKKSQNNLGHNLTELNAAESVDRGFLAHTDWLAHALRYLRVRDHMAKRMKTGYLLDVGCGTLQLEYFLYRNRLPAIEGVTAIDLRAQEKWLDDYKWKTPLTLVQMDIVQDMEAFDGWVDTQGHLPVVYDTVVCLETLEHVPRRMVPTLLDFLYNHLTEGGTCFLSTPNRAWSSSDTIADNHVGPDGEIREWWCDDLKGAIETAGFVVEEMAGTFMKTRNVPENLDPAVAEMIKTMKRRLPYALYSTTVASLFPREATNIIWTLRKPASE